MTKHKTVQNKRLGVPRVTTTQQHAQYGKELHVLKPLRPWTCCPRRLTPMGSSHSYVTDPNTFAAEVKENDDRSHWKTHDYVIVGGGPYYVRYGLWNSELLTSTPS